MSDETVEVTVPEARYTLVNCTREGTPEVISVNSALLEFVHTAIFPWHLRVRMFIRHVADNGMPTPDESELLFGIADRIEAAVLAVRTRLGSQNGIFLARSTWNEIRELYFRVHDPEPTDEALKGLLKSEAWERDWEYQMTHDAEWHEAGYIFRLLAPEQAS